MVFAAFRRKAAQLVSDPTLRRWTLERALGRQRPAPSYTPGRPPYIRRLPDPSARHGLRVSGWSELCAENNGRVFHLPLPGEGIDVSVASADAIFERAFDDLEVGLAVHRFAWLPLLGDKVAPALVSALWQSWLRRYRTPSDDWPWHPYTAAERAVNLLRFGRSKGLPAPLGETLSSLADHAAHIASHLEYHGEHNTSNHLANNGRGLFIIGLELGLPVYADLGAQLLVEEARRIFCPSGVLREGSSHYHLLLTRSYVECWLWARRHGHVSAGDLETIARQALTVLPHLSMPGGFPLVGDISPDCPPEYLAGLTTGHKDPSGWLELLSEDDRVLFDGLRRSASVADDAMLSLDGWLRAAHGPWSGVWHVAPEGWPPMPGHGHQDCGSFEMHFENEVVIRDLGRGRYGSAGEGAVAAVSHNGLTVDDIDPYPANKPYYGESFRASVAPPPTLRREADGVTVAHPGYRRLGLGIAERRWRFAPDSVVLEDRVAGQGRHRISRRFHTTLPVELTTSGAVLRGRAAKYRVSADAPISLRPDTCWTAYGAGVPATRIEISGESELPWSGSIALSVERPDS